ncbi:MAG: hypothetical protein RX318_03935 [bacterium]|nr:hypothetical protein [bacterium]
MVSPYVLTKCKLFVAEFDLSGDMNALDVKRASEVLDRTTFGASERRRLGGLKAVLMEHSGYWNGGADNVDDVLFAKIGVSAVPVTVGPETGAAGERGNIMLATFGEYMPKGVIGEIFAFNVSIDSDGDLIDGTILFNGIATATGNGTAYQVGAVSATQSLYAALHVVAASGTTPTLDVILQSDTVGFPSPTSRITFAQKTAIGSEWATPVAGAITDDWWRINYTIGGGSPSFTFIVTIGILEN